ncbi:MAG: EamA family transporter [Bacillota bacterium]
MPKIAVLVLLNVLLLVTGQVLWKVGLNRTGPVGLADVWQLAASPWILGGLALFVVATAVWLAALSRAALSLVYPFQSLAYILGMVAGIVFFGERVPPTAWLGGFLIILGIYLVSLR